MVIGICGGSGSGKTYLTEALVTKFKHLKPSVFQLDNYYLPKNQQVIDETGAINFDLPGALNSTELIADFQRLINGETITCKRYNYNVASTEPENILLAPSPLILVEGLFLLHFEALKQHLDFKVFINVEPDLQWNRRLKRDQLERGYSEKDIAHQWKHHVLPAYEQFIAPYQNEADFSFDNTADFEQHLNELYQRIQLQMNQLDASKN